MTGDDRTDIAIIVAGGAGKRMGTDIPKQILELCGKPVLLWSLEAFENSKVDGVVLVVSEGIRKKCEEIIEDFGLHKIKSVVPGGTNRYDSVYEGLKAAEGLGADYVYIHDAARPMITPQLVDDMAEAVHKNGTAVAGVPVKDTIKMVKESNVVETTPDRRSLWQIQTPQCFKCNDLVKAYDRMYANPHDDITDDASVMERFSDETVLLFEAFYDNIKVTTPEDMAIAAALIKLR